MLNDFCTIAERLAVLSLDISEKNVGTIHDLYSENVGIIHDLYSEKIGIIHDLYSKNVGTIHDLYSENLGIINKFYSENVGTIHELSLARVSGYAYLIFGNIYSLSSGIIGISVMIWWHRTQALTPCSKRHRQKLKIESSMQTLIK